VSLPIVNKFSVKPSIGTYLSFPIGLKIKRTETGYTTNYNYDGKYDLETKAVIGIQTGIKVEYAVNENNSVVFGVNYKYDFTPIRASYRIGYDLFTWNFRRQVIPIFIGYEMKF
jgi:hypothetical protein